MADRRYDAPPTTERIAGEDLYGEDLTGRTGHGIEYVDVDLTESRSEGGTVFEECLFREVRFNAAEYTGAAFLNCLFVRCSLFGAVLTEGKFVGSSFERCGFDQLTVARGDWSFAGLAGADLRSASFTDVRMREVDLTQARCDGATLVGLDLSGAALAKASFVGADLRRSDLSAFDPATVTLRGAIIGWDQAAVIAAALGLDVRAG